MDALKSARMRLIGAVGLFVAWMGWLGYLALTARHPLVLSRPQFLVSSLDVIAQIKDKDDTQIVVREVHWPNTADLKKELVGKKISIVNLQDAKGWNGPGEYILALVRTSTGSY